MNSRCQRRALRTNSRAPATDSPTPPGGREGRPPWLVPARPSTRGESRSRPRSLPRGDRTQSDSSLPWHGPTPQHFQHHERHDADNEDPHQLPCRRPVTADDEHHAETDAARRPDDPAVTRCHPVSLRPCLFVSDRAGSTDTPIGVVGADMAPPCSQLQRDDLASTWCRGGRPDCSSIVLRVCHVTLRSRRIGCRTWSRTPMSLSDVPG